jgi:hypothetical protein
MFSGGFEQHTARTGLASGTYSATSGNTEIGCGRSTAITIMEGPIKHSVAVLIFRGDQILVVRRPNNDDELPAFGVCPPSWIPPIAVAGMAVYTGDRFPKWKGNVFVGSMPTGEIQEWFFANIFGSFILSANHRIRYFRAGF